MKYTKNITESEEYFWRLRAFLRQLYFLNNRQPLCWPTQRLDYWKWHIATLGPKDKSLPLVIWETPEDEIIAAMVPEEKAHPHLQIHPAYNTPEFIEEMVATAEEHLYGRTKENKRRVYIWAHDHDHTRRQILEQRGFQKIANKDWYENQHTCDLNGELPNFETAPGYTIRSLGGPEEIPARSWASWRAFHPDLPDEDYEGWDWYPVNIQSQPLYRRDLDIVAVAPGGEIAAFTTLWYDDVTRSGYFEPVATVPEHQRKGLGKAVMLEGMRRIKKMGALAVSVSGFSEPANKLYAAVVSEDVLVYAPWVKDWED